MVIQGYGVDANEVAAREESDFRDRWQAEKARVARTVPINLREELIGLYLTTEHERTNQTPDIFVNTIAWRVYTEVCMNPEGNFNPDVYNGEALLKFIDDETLYAADRGRTKGLLHDPTSSDTLRRVKHHVLDGLVKRAAELFARWQIYAEPLPPCKEERTPGGALKRTYDDKDNLRCSLEQYIGF